MLALFDADTTFGCIPLTVSLTNASVNAVGYTWQMGNGASFTTPNASTTFTTPGTYTITLTANNPNSCNVNNTATLSVTALDTIITAQFTETLPAICDPPNVQFNSMSGAGLTYTWQFGDGTNLMGDHAQPQHLYPSAGTYNVSLIVSSPCAPPDTTQHPITILPQPLVSAELSLTPQQGCPPLAVTMQALGSALSYQWDLGDGTTANTATVVHTYTQSGNYTVQLTAIDSTTCNVSATATATVQVGVFAHADFDVSTTTIEASDPIYFTNLSINADSYAWNFGDGTTSTETNPSHTFNSAGQFEVCLSALNAAGCNDDTCVLITVIPRIYIGIPNAFSPNSDSQNDVLWVEGRDGMVLMDFRVYNRWGEMVFQTNDPQAGWDGTYKGVPQEMDAYAYTFAGTLISGRQVSGQGNITLVR